MVPYRNIGTIFFISMCFLTPNWGGIDIDNKDSPIPGKNKTFFLTSNTKSHPSHNNEDTLRLNDDHIINDIFEKVHNAGYKTQPPLDDNVPSILGEYFKSKSQNEVFSNQEYLSDQPDNDKITNADAMCGHVLSNYTLSKSNLINDGEYEIIIQNGSSICGILFIPQQTLLHNSTSHVFNVWYSSNDSSWNHITSGIFSNPLNFLWINNNVYPSKIILSKNIFVTRIKIQFKPGKDNKYIELSSYLTISFLDDSSIPESVKKINLPKNGNDFGELGSEHDQAIVNNYHDIIYENVRGETRTTIEHPSDGRLIHLDAEDYDLDATNNIVIDRSLMDNNGILRKHATVKDEHWSCRHVIKFIEQGDRVELQATKMTFIPKLKITVMAYIKLDQFEDINPIFSVVGLHPDPFFNQLNLDILKDGSIRWKYVKQNGDVGYEAQTDSGIIKLSTWYHIVATYQIVNYTNNGIASIYVNGTLKAKYHGNGFIPKDWEGLILIGYDQNDHQLYGAIDEFVIFDRILNDEEIKVESAKCVADRYYSGGNVWRKSGTIMSPYYPSLYRKAVSSKWKIAGNNDEIVEIRLEEYVIGDEDDNSSCQRTTLIIKETESGKIIDKLCKMNEPKIYTPNINSVTILFETSGEDKGIKYKIRFKIINNTIIKRNAIDGNFPCLYDKIYKNMKILPQNEPVYIGELKYSSNAQIFECANMICETQSLHNTAYTINGSCYSVDCGADHKDCLIKAVDQNNEYNEYVAILKAKI